MNNSCVTGAAVGLDIGYSIGYSHLMRRHLAIALLLALALSFGVGYSLLWRAVASCKGGLAVGYSAVMLLTCVAT